MEQDLNRLNSFTLASIVAPSLLLAVPAYAADPLTTFEPQNAATDHWDGSLTVYGWYAGWVSGDFGVGGLGPVDIGDGDSTVDLLEILDGFFMANGDLRYGRFGVYGDFIYVGLGNNVTGPAGFVDAEWGFDAAVFTGAATFQLVDTPASELHAVAGFRYWGLDVDLEFIPPLGAGPSASASRDLFDPVVGLRGRHSFTESFFVEGTGLIGGALGDTDFMWDAYAGLGYNFTDHFSGSVGYRGMGFDFEDGGTVLDLTFHGPVAGLTLRF